MKFSVSNTIVCISLGCLFLLPGCKKFEDIIETQKNSDGISNSNNDAVITPTASPKLWGLYEEKDELTGKKTEFLRYAAKVNIQNYPNANIESKVYCDDYSESMIQGFQGFLFGPQIAKVSGSFPREVITVYDSPSLKTETVTVDNKIFTVLKSRGIGLNNSQLMVSHYQGDFSNVFVQSFSKGAISIGFSEIIKNGDFDESSIANKLKESAIKNIPTRVEIQFSNGVNHIINYDDSFFDYAKQCIGRLKVSELKIPDKSQ